MSTPRDARDEDVSVIARRFCVCEWEGFCSVCLDRAYAEVAGRPTDGGAEMSPNEMIETAKSTSILSVLAARPCEKYHDYGSLGHTTVPSPKCQTEPCLVCRARIVVYGPSQEAGKP
jgi:hypothetical protein